MRRPRGASGQGAAPLRRKRGPLLFGLLLSLGMLSAFGCAGGAKLDDPFAAGGGGAGSIRIHVINNNFNEATLLAIARMQRRIGRVPGHGQEVFSMDWPTVGDLRVRIDMLAGREFTTNRISVSPGEEVFLTIENPVTRSFLRR